MTMQGEKWHVVIRAEDVPATGSLFGLTTDEALRASVARDAGLLDLPRLEARLEVARHGEAGLHVTGRVKATVVQACVVTLEPVTSELDETIDLVLVPESEREQEESVDLEAAVDLAAEEPEMLVGGRLDLGALATEFMILGIDPYPRKADAVFESPLPPEPEASAFAALAALKSKLPASS